MSKARGVSGSSFVLAVAGLVTAGATLAGCGSDEGATQFPGDRVVFSVGSFGGWRPAALQEARSPDLLIYGDGRVVYTASSAGTAATPEYLVVQADPAEISDFVGRLESDGLLDAEVDFGSPGVTDQPTTVVRLHGRGDFTEVQVPAFQTRFEDDLPSDVRERRRQLRAALLDAWGLVDTEPERFVPPRVIVHELPVDGNIRGEVPEWPGPDPDGFLQSKTPTGRGGELGGEEAAVAYAAAVENQDGIWRVGGETMRLVVDPIP